VRGEVRLWVYNAHSDLLKEGVQLFVSPHPRSPADSPPPPRHALTVTRVRLDAKGALVAFSEIRRREEAQLLNHLAWVEPRSAFPEAGDDEFYLVDLIGTEGFAYPLGSDATVDPHASEGARPLGRLTGIVEAGAGDLLVFAGSELGEVMVPNVEAFVISLDPAQGYIKVWDIPGLLEGGL
jgi:16S rRNA processing protein RimM